MKKTIFRWGIILSLPKIILAATLSNVISLVDNAPLIKANNAKTVAYQKLYEVQKSQNYPALDISYSATYLKDKPVLFFANQSFQIQSQNYYSGSIKLSYPLFTGFAISSLIDKAKFEAQKVALQAQDVKRNMYLNIVALYGTALSLKNLELSEKKAYNATKKSYTKAQAFFALGLISQSELFRLDASLHEIQAKRINTQNNYNIVLTQLSSLLHVNITNVENFPLTHELSLEKLTQDALQKRPDLLALKKSLHVQEAQITLVKSTYFPTVALFAQATQIGDSAQLNGDGFSNKDRSAAGFVVNYNLFSGFKTTNQIQAAKAAKLSTLEMLHVYEDKVKSELKQSYLNYTSLLAQKKSILAQLKSQQSYEKLIEGKFENQLSDADTLSRAIAATAMVRASLSAIESKLYISYAKLLLEVDNTSFLTRLKGQNND
ncbi:TolC family protein [Sulfurimonas sp.]